MSFLNYLFHLVIYYFKLDFLKKLNAESRFVELFFIFYSTIVIATYTSHMVDLILRLLNPMEAYIVPATLEDSEQQQIPHTLAT